MPEFAVEHQAHADTGADGHEREIVDAAAVTVDPFGQRGRVDVVLDHQRGPNCRAVPPACPENPSRTGDRQGQRIELRIVDTRASDHGLDELRRLQAHLTQERRGEVSQLLDARCRVGSLGADAQSAANGCGQIGYRTAQILAPDVQPRTKPASGRTSYRTAAARGCRSADPTRARARRARYCPAPPDTVGFDRPDRVASSVRKPARIAGCDRAVPAR